MNMKLYQIKNGSKMRLHTDSGLEDFTFGHIDGMYSFITRDSDGALCHLAAWTPVKKKNGAYEIIPTKE